MTLSITDDRITSDVTPHVADRHPSPVPSEHGWIVSWLPGRVLGRNLAISAMMIAELAVSIDGDEERRLRVNDLAHELGMSGTEAIRLALAPVVHQAPVPDAGVVSCGGVGSEAFLPFSVTCPACQELNGRPVVNDAHAIPEGDEPKPADVIVLPVDDPVLIDKDGDRWQVVARNAESDVTMTIARVRRDYGPLRAVEPLADWGRELLAAKAGPVVAVEWPEPTMPAKPCPSCSHCGKTFHVDAEPTKTHDLSVRRRISGDVVIEAESEPYCHRVYLPAGVALDLGRVLALFTPAQVQLLIGELTGGEK